MIDRILIDNFKSIEHADVKLQKINLLIGPNNSGKSNFLNSFSVINKVLIACGSFFTPEAVALDLTYSEKLNKEDKQTSFEVFENNYRHPFGEINNKRTSYNSLQTFLIISTVYKIQPQRIKEIRNLDLSSNFINNSADNIGSFLQIVLNKHRDIFSKITNDLCNFNSEFKEIVVDLLPNNIINFGLKDKKERIFWSDELSEGIIFFLAILCIINQPNPPKLLLIEEPETGIHPRRIKEVIDLIRKLSDEKDIQVIMTTHSPLVVDLFEDEPECIHVFEMKDGFTEIKNLQEDIIAPTNIELQKNGVDIDTDYGTSLGDKWIYGFLGGVPV
jgi:predicted ATPase